MNEIILPGYRQPNRPTKAEKAKQTITNLSQAISVETVKAFNLGAIKVADSLLDSLEACGQDEISVDEMIGFINTIKADIDTPTDTLN